MRHGRQLPHHQAVLGGFLGDCCQEGAQIRHAQAHLHKALHASTGLVPQTPEDKLARHRHQPTRIGAEARTLSSAGSLLGLSYTRRCGGSSGASATGSSSAWRCQDVPSELAGLATTDWLGTKRTMHAGICHLHGPDGQAVSSKPRPLEKHLHVAAVLHCNSTFTLSSQVEPCKPC